MQFEPKSESEIRSSMTLSPGVYDFEVSEAHEKVSKAGNDMIELTLRVFPIDGGSPHLIRDWLVPTMELKINRFCRAVGLEDAYADGTLNAFTCGGVAGKCRISVEADEKYGDQNRIKDYIPAEVAEFQRDPEPTPAPKKTKPAKKPKDVEQEWAELAAKDDQIPF
jgi:hypothetical protein